jgi:peptide/nickel transport system substrate-binding protein
LTRGGKSVGDVAQHYIPPSVPGFKESGGFKGFDLDFMKTPTGNMKLARHYMLKARNVEGVMDIDADGMYVGKKSFLAVAVNNNPQSQTAQVVQAQLKKLGFNVTIRMVDQQTMYQLCGTPKDQVAICPNVGWAPDFNDPEAALAPVFNGSTIHPIGNVNFSMFNVPSITRAMLSAGTIPLGSERDKAWAEINRQITSKAPGVLVAWPRSFIVRSADVNGQTNSYTRNWDLSFTSLAKPTSTKSKTQNG